MKSKKYIIKVTDHSKVDGHVGYYLKIEIDNISSIVILKRYSELKILNDSLRKETSSNIFPKFPPKKLVGYNSEEFIKKWQQDLDIYFQSICSSQDFCKLPSFIKFIEDCFKSQNENKILSERPTAVVDEQLNSTKKEKSTINIYRERFRPKKADYKKLSIAEMKKEEGEARKIVDKFKGNFIEIDFQVEQNVTEKIEKKYNDIIKEDNLLTTENEISNSVEEGNDDNFNLLSYNSNINEAENNLKKMIEKEINKRNELTMIYDINEILKTLWIFYFNSYRYSPIYSNIK